MSDRRRQVEDLRQEVGKIDGTILKELERRAKLSKKIGEIKKDLGAVATLPDHGELDKLLASASGDLPPDALREIFQEISATCFSLEQPVVVSFCGLDGAFAYAAARSRFGHAAEYVACDTIGAALDGVTRQRAGYAVVPYETRTDGLIQATIAALTQSDLKIVSCFETVVNLQLASKASSFAEIEKVYAIAKDRAHCQRFLATELPGAQIIDVKTPAGACQLAAADPRAAAFAHEAVAVEHGLEILRRNVRDEGDERVRYAIVGTRPSSRSGNDLTALVVAVADAPGALHDLLKQFAERGVNLTKIQSRPAQSESWQYIFFIEVVGHPTDRNVVGAIEEVRRQAKFFKVLGSYQAI
jgi:chorismate mutase / prephenate dehydratase